MKEKRKESQPAKHPGHFHDAGLSEKLRQEGQFLRTVLGVVDAVVLVLDGKGKPLYFNQAFERMTGYSREEIMKMDLASSPTLSEEDKRHYGDYIARMISGERPLSWENWGIHKDGTRRRIMWTNTVIVDGAGDLECIIVSGIDITARWEAEESLRQAKETAENATALKDKFVSMVSHDLKQPLSTIVGYLKLLEQEVTAHEKPMVKEMFNHVLSGSMAMAGMVDRLLNLGRLRTGKVELRKEFVPARQLAQKVLDGLNGSARQKGIGVSNGIPDGVRVFADRDLLGEVIQNLVSNAIKFSHGGGAISVYCPEGRHGVVAVKDAGSGIDPKMVPDLFRHDVKTSTSGTAGETGMGLGLPFCMEIMEAHGGTIVVESAPGAGSTFYLELPVKKPSVLVVEDDDILRMVLSMELAQKGFTLAEAENGHKALEAIAACRPDVIVTDLMMPMMDGFTLIENVKKLADMALVPIIAMSASTTSDTRKRVLALGVADFMTKPFSADDLARRINHYL